MNGHLARQLARVRPSDAAHGPIDVRTEGADGQGWQAQIKTPERVGGQSVADLE